MGLLKMLCLNLVDYHIQPYLRLKNKQLSPTFETILKIISGLNIDISELLTSIQNKTPQTRQALQEKEKGEIHGTENYIYETLCNGIINTKMIPIATRIKSHRLEQFGKIMPHSGDNFFVIEGTIELITEHYASVNETDYDKAVEEQNNWINDPRGEFIKTRKEQKKADALGDIPLSLMGDDQQSRYGGLLA
mgnify:FL=1